MVKTVHLIPRTTALARLGKGLGARSGFVRAQAAEALGKLGDFSAVPLLERHRGDRSPEVRMNVIAALGALNGSEPEIFVEALQDKDELVRVEAAEALGLIRKKGAVSALRRALNDPSPLVRSYAAAALGGIGSASDRKLLRARRRHQIPDEEKLGVLEGLWLLKDRTALVEALELLNSRDYRVRSATAKALTSTFISSQTRPRIIQALQKRLDLESSRAVRGAIQNVLRHI